MASMEFSVSPASVRAARAFTSDWLGPTTPVDAVRCAQLVVSELATNAIEHAGTAFVVDIQRDNEWIRVALTDGSETPPLLRVARIQDVTGRGLALVDQLCERWGFETSQAQKTVWCEILIDQRRRPF